MTNREIIGQAIYKLLVEIDEIVRHDILDMAKEVEDETPDDLAPFVARATKNLTLSIEARTHLQNALDSWVHCPGDDSPVDLLSDQITIIYTDQDRLEHHL